MKGTLLTILFALSCLATFAQSTLDADFEDGALPTSWTQTKPDSPYKGGFSVVTYASQSALKATNVGSNDLGGTYVMRSMTGGLNNFSVKGNSDNWFISPAVTISDAQNIFSFRLAANCSYSPIWPDNQMKMDIVVIEGDAKTVIGTIAPENYFTWKQYAFDLSAYTGKTVKVAFHDYGTAAASAVADMKYIDNVKLSNEKLCDYSIEETEPIHGQAMFTQPYTIKVTNYGVSTGSFKVNYAYGETAVSETVNETIASGASTTYTFKTAPSFTPGSNVTFKSWVSTTGDSMNANDTITKSDLAICPVQDLPYSVINTIVTYKDIYGNDSTAVEDDKIAEEFDKIKTMVLKASSYDKKIEWWPYDMEKYHAWVFQQGDSTEKYRGICYLYTTKALSLPAGKVYLTTTGTGTGPDMHYEVYIAKYWDSDLTSSPILVGTSPNIPDAKSTEEPFSTVTTELTIPEAGDYTIAIRPLTALIAQMTVIGYSVSTGDQDGIEEVQSSEINTQSANSYNLMGQRVNASTKGIVIRNGKKYINR